MHKRYLPILTLGALLATAALPAAADVIVGAPALANTGNCFPFGCDYEAQYQQVYNASAFSGPITIVDLEFFNTQYHFTSSQLPSGSYTITLATLPSSHTISSNYASNLASSSNVSEVWSGNINQPWSFGSTLHIPLSSAYDYDPSAGNLLLDVVAANVSLPSGGVTVFDATDSADVTRIFCLSGISCTDGQIAANYGLVTGFSTKEGPVSVPEPGTLSLVALQVLGLAGVGIWTRRRRTA